MSEHVTTHDARAPSDIAELAESARVVVFRSNLTDTRALEGHLDAHGIDYRVITMGMGSAAQRERFHRLRDWTGWNLLPIVFVDDTFVGGADEYFAEYGN
jgi:glutaredoxin